MNIDRLTLKVQLITAKTNIMKISHDPTVQQYVSATERDDMNDVLMDINEALQELRDE